MILGSFLLNSQYHIQRFIAISSTAHIGFLILQYNYSYLFYIYIYSITSLILFFLFFYNFNNFFLKIFITFFLFSLSGLPPLPGFYSKLYILIDLLNLGYLSLIFILFFSSIILTGNYIYLGLISIILPSYFRIYPYSTFISLFFTLF